MLASECLRSLAPPWAFLIILKPGESARVVLTAPAGFITRVADGRRCRTKVSLLSELARALEFPEEAAPNWDAVEEGLADLEWLPGAGYVIGVSHAEDLLSESPEDYDIFISILEEVGKEWSSPRAGEWPRPALPFHVCLTVLEGREAARRDWRIPILER